MIRVTLVPIMQSGRFINGVLRYLFGILSHSDPESLNIDLRILHRGHEMPAKEWSSRFPMLRQTANRAWKLDEYLLRPLALYRSRADMIHYPLGWLPRGWKTSSVPILITLHGAARLTGSWHSTESKSQREQLKKQIRSGLSKLARIITVSQWSREEIIEAYGLRPDVVEVIPNGIDMTKFHSLNGKEKVLGWLRKTLGIQEPYLLYVGPCSPRKNTLRLVQAFGHLKRYCRIPHQLVLAGAPGQLLPAVKSEVNRLNLTDDVVFTGPVGDKALLRLYNGASVFVFPSLYEGFGLPMLEAMACGTPVVTSNRTALPEIAGGAAALIEDPTDTENLADVIQQVLENTAHRGKLRQLGLARARTFSLEACATAHLELYQQVAEEHGGKR